MKKVKTTLKFLVPVVIVLLVILVATSFYTVQENEYACVVRFSKIIDVTDSSGLHFKMPFVDTVIKFPKTVLLYDIPPSDVITSDSKSMQVDSYVMWKISDPLAFYKSLGSIVEAEVRLDNITYNALKTTMGTIEQDEIINMDDGAKRNEIYSAITAQVTEKAVIYGIDIIDVKVKRLDYPTDNEQAVYTRMISERNMMAEELIANGNKTATITKNEVDRIVNETLSNAEREAEEIIAAGEAEYMRILGEAYNTPDKQEFYYFIRALDALKTSLAGESKTVILGADSELAQILNNALLEEEAELPPPPSPPS